MSLTTYMIWATISTCIAGIVWHFFGQTPAIVTELILLLAPFGGGSGSSCSGGCDCDWSDSSSNDSGSSDE